VLPFGDDLARFGRARGIDANLDRVAERQVTTRTGEEFAVDARRT
jgi:hypothetical protein